MEKPWVLLGGIVALVLAWVLRHVLLLVFASILLAIFLWKGASWLQSRVRMPLGIALAMVVVAIAGSFALVGVWQGPRIAEEVEVLRRELPAAFDNLQTRVSRSETARQVTEELPSPREIVGEGSDLLDRLRSVAATTTVAVAAFGLWIFLAILLAATPGTYIRGLLALVPRRHEQRARSIIDALRETLWWWSIGRIVAMTFVGVATTIGLSLLGIPLAFLLGLIAAILSFVPNIGPILSAVPAILLALADDPILALWVALLYFGVQMFESLVLDPIVDRATVYLPPALTVTTQLALGILAGLAGVALAAPLTAAGIVLVSLIWVEDVLGKSGASIRGQES